MRPHKDHPRLALINVCLFVCLMVPNATSTIFQLYRGGQLHSDLLILQKSFPKPLGLLYYNRWIVLY
jgi:hypothetical protein